MLTYLKVLLAPPKGQKAPGLLIIMHADLSRASSSGRRVCTFSKAYTRRRTILRNNNKVIIAHHFCTHACMCASRKARRALLIELYNSYKAHLDRTICETNGPDTLYPNGIIIIRAPPSCDTGALQGPLCHKSRFAGYPWGKPQLRCFPPDPLFTPDNTVVWG